MRVLHTSVEGAECAARKLGALPVKTQDEPCLLLPRCGLFCSR